MGIKIKHINNKKKYLNEMFGISTHYKQLIINPNKKVTSYVNERIYITIAIVAFVIFMIIVKKHGLWFNCFVIGITFMAVLVYLKDIIDTTKYIRKDSKEESDSELSITKDRIIFKNNKLNFTFEEEWDNIEYILITDYCISFLPKEPHGFLIVISKDYKKDCFELIKKYKKEQLIFDQTKNNKKTDKS